MQDGDAAKKSHKKYKLKYNRGSVEEDVRSFEIRGQRTPRSQRESLRSRRPASRGRLPQEVGYLAVAIPLSLIQRGAAAEVNHVHLDEVRTPE